MTEPRHATPSIDPTLPPSEDPLAEPLRLLKLTGVLHCRATLTAPWGLDLPEIAHCLAIHVVTAGRCYLDVPGETTRELPAGSMAMLPHGSAHQLRSTPAAAVTPLTDIPVQLITDRYEHMTFGGGGSETRISYCGVRIDPVSARRLLAALPQVIQLDARNHASDWLQDTARLIAREADAMRPGSEAIITRLADILVVQALRTWVADTRGQHGWLEALNDRYLGRALGLIHRQPERPWTVASLAAAVGLSRSALSERFTTRVGVSVKQYITEWRMHLARADLLESGASLLTLAERYGYGSEAAFSRAFKRVMGVAPGQARMTEHTHRQDQAHGRSQQ